MAVCLMHSPTFVTWPLVFILILLVNWSGQKYKLLIQDLGRHWTLSENKPRREEPLNRWLAKMVDEKWWRYAAGGNACSGVVVCDTAQLVFWCCTGRRHLLSVRTQRALAPGAWQPCGGGWGGLSRTPAGLGEKPWIRPFTGAAVLNPLW